MSKKNKSNTPPNRPAQPVDASSENTPVDLKNINIRINRFGAIERSLPVDEVNAFLNAKVPDKKRNEEEDGM
jgi:hypothetical protein